MLLSEKARLETYVERLNKVDFLATVAAGTAPDTAFVDSSNYETFAKKGLLLDITDKITGDKLLGAKDYFIQPQESARCADDKGRWHGIGSTWVAPHSPRSWRKIS